MRRRFGRVRGGNGRPLLTSYTSGSGDGSTRHPIGWHGQGDGRVCHADDHDLWPVAFLAARDCAGRADRADLHHQRDAGPATRDKGGVAGDGPVQALSGLWFGLSRHFRPAGAGRPFRNALPDDRPSGHGLCPAQPVRLETPAASAGSLGRGDDRQFCRVRRRAVRRLGAAHRDVPDRSRPAQARSCQGTGCHLRPWGPCPFWRR